MSPDTNPDLEHTPVKRGRGRPRTRPVRPRKSALPLSSPADQEDMARWVEDYYSGYHAAVARESAWLSAHPDDKESRGKLDFYRHSIAVSRQLAYAIRTGRLRDLT